MTASICDFNYNHLFSLKEKVAFISGAGGHLGTSLAYSLAQAGAHVILNGRDEAKLQQLQATLQQAGFESTILAFDITNKSLMTEKLAFVHKQFNQLDIIVNNAHSGRACPFTDTKREDFIRDYQINVISSFELIQASLGLLKQAVANGGDASIINIASMYGNVSPDPRIYLDSRQNNPPHYGAAKAGLIQLTKYMACHLAADKIRVNAISPGPFPQQAALMQSPAFKEKLLDKIPLGRVGDPSELQGPLLFLASAASSYVTGINLAVDGGWTAW